MWKWKGWGYLLTDTLSAKSEIYWEYVVMEWKSEKLIDMKYAKNIYFA